MLMAVSTLSPVRTQVLIPARARLWMVSGTPTCSLSSMAVAPRIFTSRSTPMATAVRRAARFASETLAACELRCNNACATGV